MRFIEETWSSEKLGNLCKITMGQSPSSKNYSKNSNDTILIQGNADLISGKIVPRIYTSEITKLSYPGDIILTVRAPVGDLAINEFDSCIGRGVCSIKGNKFIYYYLESLKDKHVWERLSQGSTFESVNSNDIKNLNLKIPSNSTQNHIINFFTAIDTKIELLQKKHGEYIRFKQYLMQNIFADKSAEKLRFKDTENNLYPNWEFLHLKDIITLNGGYAFKSELFKDEGIPIIRISNISQDNSVVANDLVYYDKLKNDHKFIIKKGELIIAMSGATTGKVAVYDFEQISYINQRVGLFKQISNKLYYPFLVQYSLSNSFKKELQKTLVAGAQPNISKKEIEEFKIDLPYYEEQKKIADLLHNIDLKINSIKKQTFEISEFKKSLLQQMFVVRINWRCNFKLAKSPSFNKHLLILKNKIIFIIIE